MQKHKPSLIESIAEKPGIIENLHGEETFEISHLKQPGN